MKKILKKNYAVFILNLCEAIFDAPTLISLIVYMIAILLLAIIIL
jgi:hypothetical protein